MNWRGRRTVKGMIKSIKRLVITALICYSMITLCACGKNDTVLKKEAVKEVSKDSEALEESKKDIEANQEEKETDDRQNTIADSNVQDDSNGNLVDEVSNKIDWKAAYLSYLDIMEMANTYTYSLIYVDEDDIPELLMDSGFEAGGCKILTFHDGIVDEWQSSRLNVTYLEKENLICNSDGLMGCYYDYIYTIQDGKWCPVVGGEWGYEWPAEEMIYTYKWNGTEVSEDEYKTHLNEVFPQEREKHPEKYYILKEIISILISWEDLFAAPSYSGRVGYICEYEN